MSDSMDRTAKLVAVGVFVALMVDGMDGEISCESHLGEGTTFTVLLPAWE